MTDLAVSRAIYSQLGPEALFLLSAKKFMGDDLSLWFAIGDNPKGVHKVLIRLDEASDTYTVEFWTTGRKVSESEGVAVDSLLDVIENHTGLWTSARRRRR